jgi:hypothetical protein
MGSRILKRKSPFSPDRTHIHHKLLDLGFTHIQTTMMLLVLNGAFIFFIFMLQNLEIHLLATILIFTGVIKSLLPDYIAGYFQKRSPKLVFKLDKTTHVITEEAKKNGIKFKN